jgi:hypothetical protein
MNIQDQLTTILKSGILAPSVDNCQPWSFVIQGTTIDLFLDRQRAEFFGDYQFTASYVTFGTVIENMTVAAAHEKCTLKVDHFPVGSHGPVARLTLLHPADVKQDCDLFSVIAARCTNRRPYSRVSLTAETVTALQNIALPSGARLHLIQDRRAIASVARQAAAIDSIIFNHKQLHFNLFRWLRWDDRSVETSKDGLPLKSLELKSLDAFFLRCMAWWPFQRICNLIGVNHVIGLINSRLLVNAGALAAITMDVTTPEAYIQGGQAMERVWLSATNLGLAVHPFGGLPFLLTRYMQGGGEGLTSGQAATLANVQRKMAEIFPLPSDHAFIILFRFGRAPHPSFRAIRRPLSDVIRSPGLNDTDFFTDSPSTLLA